MALLGFPNQRSAAASAAKNRYAMLVQSCRGPFGRPVAFLARRVERTSADANTRRPPRALKRQAGVIVAKAFFALGSKPSYILDFALGCRCQAVGNSVSPGGVMSVAHPPCKLTTKVIYNCGCRASRGDFPSCARQSLKPTKASSILLALSIGECQFRVRGYAI